MYCGAIEDFSHRNTRPFIHPSRHPETECFGDMLTDRLDRVHRIPAGGRPGQHFLQRQLAQQLRGAEQLIGCNRQLPGAVGGPHPRPNRDPKGHLTHRHPTPHPRVTDLRSRPWRTAVLHVDAPPRAIGDRGFQLHHVFATQTDVRQGQQGIEVALDLSFGSTVPRRESRDDLVQSGGGHPAKRMRILVFP